MKVAVVASPNTLQYTLPSDYHMALAHLVRDNEVYRDFYTTAARFTDHEVILDNGAAEFGSAMHFDALLPIVREVQPTVWVMPDVVKNMIATLWHYNMGLTYKNLPEPFMVVPQGADEQEWGDCLEHMVRHVAFVPGTWIGISKFCLEYTTRVRLLGIVDFYRTDTNIPIGPVHLLGLEDPMELRSIVGLCPWVHGVDTMKPISYGLEQIKLEDYRPGIHGDETDTRSPAPYSFADVCIKHNVEYLKELANDK